MERKIFISFGSLNLRLRQKVLVLLLIGWIPALLNAESRKTENFGTFSIYYENDGFAGTDHYYTNGFKMAWISKDIGNRCKNLLRKPNPLEEKLGVQRFIFLSLAQNIYTPDDIERRDLIEDDRPYAGFLYFGIGVYRKTSRYMDTVEVNLGIVGPHSYAESIQKFIHSITHATRPNGWHNQLKDEFAFAVFFNRKWRLFQSGTKTGFGFDAIPHLGGGLGNVFTYFNAGTQFRFGWNLPKGFGTGLIRPGSECNIGFFERSADALERSKFGIHFFAGVDGQAVLRNIFLDGNTLRESHRIEKKNFVGVILAGIGVKLGQFTFSWAYTFWSKQFETESRRQIFGAVHISYSY